MKPAEAAAAFYALGDQTRTEIWLLLLEARGKELSTSRLAILTRLTLMGVTMHLKLMVEVGLLRREGNRYSINEDTAGALCELLSNRVGNWGLV